MIKKVHFSWITNSMKINTFFKCYLAFPRSPLGHYWGDILTHPVLITASFNFDPGVTGSLVAMLAPYSQPSAKWGLNREPSNSITIPQPTRPLSSNHGTRRFIDDLCAVKDGNEFFKSFKNIYAKELELKVEHTGLHGTFLDLRITIKDNTFIYKLFNKRDTFSFFMVRMPHLFCNIPSFIFYGLFY